MRSELARLGGISLDFAEIPPRWDEHVMNIWTCAGGPTQQGGIDFSLKRMRMFWNYFQIRFQNGYDQYYEISKI